MSHQSFFRCCGVLSHFVLGCTVTSQFVFVLKSYLNVCSYVVLLHNCLFMCCVVKSVVVPMFCFYISVLLYSVVLLQNWFLMCGVELSLFFLCCSVTSLLVFHICSFLCFVLLFHCLCTWFPIIKLFLNASLLHHYPILRLKSLKGL